jgi:hypothetical protein
MNEIYNNIIVSVDLLSFLKWRTQPEMLEVNIKKLMKLGGEEIVKVSNFWAISVSRCW